MTELLDTIDYAISDWEAQPEAWNPGDPIYDHPWKREERGEDDVQHVRPMIQLVDERTATARCEPCQVTWVGISACFNCGEERPPSPGPMPHAYELMVRMSVDTRPFQQAMATVAERWSRLVDERMAAALERAIDMSELFSRITVAPPRPDPRVTTEVVQGALAAARRAHPRLLAFPHDFHYRCDFGPPAPTSRSPLDPAPLSIDGHAYRRRTLARRRRNR